MLITAKGATPQTRTIGGTFEITFKLPKQANSGNTAKKRKTTRKPAKTIPAAKPAQPRARKKDGRTYQDRKDYQCATQAKRRTEHDALGLCRDCSNPRILNQTRCSSCVEKHRAYGKTYRQAQKAARGRQHIQADYQ